MENIGAKSMVNKLAVNVMETAIILVARSKGVPVGLLTWNSLVDYFETVNGCFYVLVYKDMPIAFYGDDGCFYDLTDLICFRTKKTDRIIRKFQKKYAPKFSVYYVYRP